MSDLWAAGFGLAGVLVGAAIESTTSRRLARDASDERARIRAEEKHAEAAAKEILLEMLSEGSGYRQRYLSTCCSVTGMDEPTVKRLLLDIGARGDSHDSQLWGLRNRNPFGRPDPPDPEPVVRIDASAVVTEAPSPPPTEPPGPPRRTQAP